MKMNVDDYLIWSRQMAEFAKSINRRDWNAWRESIKLNSQNTSPIWQHADNRIIEEDVVHPHWIHEKNENGEWVRKLAPWSPTLIDDFGRTIPATEVVQDESRQPLNVDVPDDLYLFEMGCGNRKNESLDHRSMDDRDMRERCVVVGNRVYALYEKRKPDLAPRSDLRQEVLANMLSDDIDYCDVDTMTRVFRDMRLSRKTVLALIHGYVRPDENGVMAKSSGLKSLDADDIAEVAADFEDMRDELAEFDIPEPETNKPRTLDDERAYWLDVSRDLFDRGKFVSVLSQIRFIEDSARRDLIEGYYEDPDHVDEFVIYQNDDYIDAKASYDDEDEAIEWDPELEETALSIDANAFGAHPLYDESSCISDDLINEIKSSDWKELSEVKSWLMGSDAWFLNSDQRKIAWGFIKGREDDLIAASLKRPIAKLVGSYITESGDSKRACAALFAWKSLDRFDTDDQILKFDEEEPPLEDELAAAWTIFRREHKDHQKARRVAKNRSAYLMNAYRDRKPGEKGPKRITVRREQAITIGA